MLSVREVSGILKVSERTVLRWIRRGDLPASRSRERVLVNPVDLLEWASARGVELSPAFLERWAQPTLPRLGDALAAGGIDYGVPGHSKEAVLRAVVRRLPRIREEERQFIYQSLLVREALGSTAIGDGIAIPHVRNPLLVHVDAPAVTLSFLEHGVDFNALDGKPVSILFTLVSPTVRAHLHLLSRLGYVLRDRAVRAVLKPSSPSHEILQAIWDAEAQLSPPAPAAPGSPRPGPATAGAAGSGAGPGGAA
ncbi:MAG TPA: PTS sugar transporter subunit IIA [Longimicrobiales bacterium]